MGAIMRVVATTGLTGMDEKDLRFANAQFQYVNHRTKAMSDAVDCATTAVSFISRLTIGIDPADPLHQLFCVKLYRLCKRIDNYATMPAPDTNSGGNGSGIHHSWHCAWHSLSTFIVLWIIKFCFTFEFIKLCIDVGTYDQVKDSR